MRFGGEVFQQLGREPRFPDPGLTSDQDHLAFAFFCPCPAPQQQFEFFLPPNKSGQVGWVQSLKAALNRPRPQHRPGPGRPGDALEVIRPEVL